MRRIAGTTFFVLLGLLGAMRTAKATPKPEPDQCHLATAPPTNAQWASRAPANAPAFVLQPKTMYSRSFYLEGSSLQSKGTPGIPLEVRPDDRLKDAILVVPQASLTPRTDYALSFDISCPSADPDFVTMKSAASFVAWDSVPLPTSSGTATAELAVNPEVFWQVASVIHLMPSPELRAYLATTMFEISVDGNKAAIASYGERYWAGLSVDATVDIAVSASADAWGQRTGVSACAAEDSQIVTKTVSVQPHVAGAETDPTPVTVDVPFDCRPPRPSEPSGSSSDDTKANETLTDADAGGCGVSGARGHRAPTLACLAAACATLAVRRRRRRLRSSSA